jgi:PhnB protein
MPKPKRKTKLKPKTYIAAFLSVRNWTKAVDFYVAAFGATETFRAPIGGVGRFTFGSSEFWVSEESPRHLNHAPESLGGTTARLLLVVPDPDAAYARAVKAGAKVVNPVHEEHGWRFGRVVDPFGHHWEIAREL